MTDETHETPEPSDATEETAAVDATEIAEPDETVEPDAITKTKRERSYVRVPTWAFAAIGAIVLAGGGFLIGRATAPDDTVDVHAAQFPSVQGTPDFRPDEPNEVPRAVARAFFGVSVERADGGVSVIRVSRGSPAEEAGFKDGDVITKVDGKEVTTPAELAERIHAHDPGDEVTITYTRDGASNEAKVRLGDRFEEVTPSN
jgi:membrane-associated protease RseP (regulator of RpoE activity)